MRVFFPASLSVFCFVLALPGQQAFPAGEHNVREVVEPEREPGTTGEDAVNDGGESTAGASSSEAGERNGYEVPEEGHLEWKPLLLQNGLFLALQHGYRFGTQEKTRRNIRGPFFRDYADSLKGFSGWHDGDEWVANYLGHPLQGAVYGFTYLNNHTRERYIPVDFKSKDYWRSRFKSMGWMAVASTHYELGPLGEAAFGNVGLEPGTKGAVDLVVTPTLGLATLVVEDFADSRLIMPLERRIQNRYIRLVLRSLLNPSRSMANLLSFKVPWYRSTRAGVGFRPDAFARHGRP
jgi:hypothetical protein